MKAITMDAKGSFMRIVLLGASLAVVFGCDYRIAPEDQAHEHQVRNQTEELAELRSGMEKFVEGKIELTKKALAPLEKSVIDVQKDIDALSAETISMMNAKDVKGADLPIEIRMRNLLQSTNVNALALRYVKTDFVHAAGVFFEQVRMVRKAERRYENALKDVEARYAENTKSTATWLSMTSSQRDAEKSRLKREIASLESSRKTVLKELQNLTKNKLTGSSRQERERMERLYVIRHQLSDYDVQIRTKRRQFDYLTDPDANREMEKRSNREQQEAQDDANRNRNRALVDLNLTLKPKRSVADLVTEVELKTVGELKKKIVQEEKEQQDQILVLKAKLQQLEEARLLVPVSDKEGLVRLRKALQN